MNTFDIPMSQFVQHFNIADYNPLQPWRFPVNSSCLSEIEYNPLSETLEVTFQDGTQGSYLLVSFNDFYNLVTSPSIGKYFNMYIRNQHTFV